MEIEFFKNPRNFEIIEKYKYNTKIQCEHCNKLFKKSSKKYAEEIRGGNILRYNIQLNYQCIKCPKCHQRINSVFNIKQQISWNIYYKQKRICNNVSSSRHFIEMYFNKTFVEFHIPRKTIQSIPKWLFWTEKEKYIWIYKIFDKKVYNVLATYIMSFLFNDMKLIV
jgi:phage FluMu protein Com